MFSIYNLYSLYARDFNKVKEDKPGCGGEDSGRKRYQGHAVPRYVFALTTLIHY